MKKILTFVCFLLVFCFLFSFESKADGESQTESKKLDFSIAGETGTHLYAFSSRKRKENDGKGGGNHLAVEDSRLDFSMNYKANDHDVDFLIGFEPSKNEIKENRIKLKGSWGTIIAGDTRGVTDFMSANIWHVAGGTGGVSGNFSNVINATTGCIIDNDLLHQLSPKDETKIIYVSPRINGFQFGYNFIPDGSHKGDAKLASHTPKRNGIKSLKDDTYFAGSNLHEFSINFVNKFQNNLNVNLSASGIIGKMRDLQHILNDKDIMDIRNQNSTVFNPTHERHDLQAFAVGGVIEQNGFSIAFEYLDNMKSGQLKCLKNVNYGKVITGGVGFRVDNQHISLTYLRGRRNLGKISNADDHIDFGGAKTDNYAFTIDHEYAPGLVFFAEGVVFNLTHTKSDLVKSWNHYHNGYGDNTVGSNKGKMIITGTRIKI